MDEMLFHAVPPARGGAPDSLVVLVHGYGADGADLVGLAEAWGRALPGAQFVAPDAPEPCEMAPFGRQWFGLADMDPARLAEGVSGAVPPLSAFVSRQAARHGLAPGRIAWMGFSQGAMLALAAGLSADPPPACILAYSGALLAGLGVARPPVLLVHGEADLVVPVAASRSAASALRAAGVPVEALFPPALGHGIDEAGIAAGAAFLARHLG
jgi:phospholipase/carboxylesterase